MIPPLRRRCPRCDHSDWSARFESVPADGRRAVVCPACGHQFEPVDQPWLN